MSYKKTWYTRIDAIIGGDDEMELDDAVAILFEHLKTNLHLPRRVTGIESFRWEQRCTSSLLMWSQSDYHCRKKTQPSYTDIYNLLNITLEGSSEWMMFSGQDIAAHVQRESDSREFILGLSELHAIDKKSRC